MNLTNDILVKIKELQDMYPAFMLSGSAALIACGIMDSRPMSDIDISMYSIDLPYWTFLTGLRIDRDYPDSGHGYLSYHGSYLGINLNLLVFEDNIQLRSKHYNVPGVGSIRHQEIDDILMWKRKYARVKDLKDLENIANKAMERVLADENI